MSYKTKSLVYFACFLLSVLAYYNLDNDNQLEADNNVEYAVVSMEESTIEKSNDLK